MGDFYDHYSKRSIECKHRFIKDDDTDHVTELLLAKSSLHSKEATSERHIPQEVVLTLIITSSMCLISSSSIPGGPS